MAKSATFKATRRRCGRAAVLAAALAALTTPAARAQTAAAGDAETATRTLNRIDWPAARDDAQEAGVDNLAVGGGLASFAGAGRETADNLQVPVLLPKSLIEANRLNRLDEPMELLARTNDYSAEAKIAPNSFLIQGTRVVFEAPEGSEEDIAPVDDPLFVEQNEYGVTASFERYGAVYTIDIFCPLPTADPLCVDEAKIRELAAEMTFAP